VERKGLTRARLHPFGVERQARRIPSGSHTESQAGISTAAIQEKWWAVTLSGCNVLSEWLLPQIELYSGWMSRGSHSWRAATGRKQRDMEVIGEGLYKQRDCS
jgi:hypothetical protein